MAAVANGANLVEVHFTDQKEGREFRDHALSFDVNDLKRFISCAAAIKKSLGSYDKFVQACEGNDVDSLRKGVVSARDLVAGQTLTRDDLMFARPATNYKASEIKVLLGKKITQNIPSGHIIPRNSIECAE